MVIDKHIVDTCRSIYGDAFYILDTLQFRSNFIELRDTFREIYPNFNIAYSYKTNYTPKLCAVVDELGGYAEVVSDMELEIAQRIGVKPSRIIWNGPIKNIDKLEDFLISGGTDNIDSIEELNDVKYIIARHKDKVFNIGIRCNYDVCDGVVSRFGFDVNGEDFKEVLSFLIESPNVHFVNLQCHFAKRQLEYWPYRVKGMIDLVDRIGIIPERIDIGGGMFGKMEDSLKSQFPFEIPNYKEYAKTAATMFAEYFADKDHIPELLIEPGSALVGDCMKFVGTVKSIKNVRGKWFATIYGSQKNISMTGVNPPMEVIHMGNTQKKYTDLDIVGYTCIEGDVIYKDYCGELADNDVVVISNCGSYSLVMKPPFILPNFPVVDIVSETKIELIKRAELFDDLFSTFSFSSEG